MGLVDTFSAGFLVGFCRPYDGNQPVKYEM